jgi:hypothetical protein
MPSSSARVWRSFAFGVGVVVAIYSVMGIAMAADLQGPGYRTAARVYVVLFIASVAVIVWGIVSSWRAARSASRSAT